MGVQDDLYDLLSKALFSGEERDRVAIANILRTYEDRGLSKLADLIDPNLKGPVEVIFAERSLGRRRSGNIHKDRVEAHQAVAKLHGAKVSRALVDWLNSEFSTVQISYSQTGTTLVFHISCARSKETLHLCLGEIIDQATAFRIVAWGFSRPRSTIRGWYYEIKNGTLSRFTQ